MQIIEESNLLASHKQRFSHDIPRLCIFNVFVHEVTTQVVLHLKPHLVSLPELQEKFKPVEHTIGIIFKALFQETG